MYWMGSSFVLDERAICTLWPAALPTSLNGPLQRTFFSCLLWLTVPCPIPHLQPAPVMIQKRHTACVRLYAVGWFVCCAVLYCPPPRLQCPCGTACGGGVSVLCPALWWRGRRCVGYPMTVPFSVADDESVILTRQYSPARTVRCEPSGRVVVRSKTTILFCDVRPHICSRERLL